MNMKGEYVPCVFPHSYLLLWGIYSPVALLTAIYTYTKYTVGMNNDISVYIVIGLCFT